MYDHPLCYSPFCDGELLFLASRINSLMPDARNALEAELKRRGLKDPKESSDDYLGRYHSISDRVQVTRID